MFDTDHKGSTQILGVSSLTFTLALEGAQLKAFLVIVRKRDDGEVIARAEFDTSSEAQKFVSAKVSDEYIADIVWQGEALRPK